jgi:hypothetical protein
MGTCVHFEAIVLVDTREHGLRGDLVADTHRHVTDHAVGGRADGEVLEAHLIFLDVRVLRAHRGFRGLERSLRLLEFFAARGPGRVELARPLDARSREGHGRLARRLLSLLARNGGLLAAGVDLDERVAGLHAVS